MQYKPKQRDNVTFLLSSIFFIVTVMLIISRASNGEWIMFFVNIILSIIYGLIFMKHLRRCPNHSPMPVRFQTRTGNVVKAHCVNCHNTISIKHSHYDCNEEL